MEEVRKVEGLSVEELKAESVELLPDREEMNLYFFSGNFAAAGQNSNANAGNLNIAIRSFR
jgi:hypothetical protein